MCGIQRKCQCGGSKLDARVRKCERSKKDVCPIGDVKERFAGGSQLGAGSLLPVWRGVAPTPRGGTGGLGATSARERTRRPKTDTITLTDPHTMSIPLT